MYRSLLRVASERLTKKNVKRRRSSRNVVGVPTTRPMLIEVGSKVAHNATLPTKRANPPWAAVAAAEVVCLVVNCHVQPECEGHMNLESIASQIGYGYDSLFMHASGKLAPYHGEPINDLLLPWCNILAPIA